MKISKTLVAFDLETTGVWVEKDRIIEIALIKCTPSGGREVYCKRVNPQMPIPAAVSSLTGITDADVSEAPLFKDIAFEVLSFIADSDLTGFNIERFDLPLLEREMNDAGHKFDWRQHKVYDVQKVFHLNEKRDLTAAYFFYCNKRFENVHSALPDTEATLEIISAQVAKYGEGSDSITSLEKFNYKNNSDYFDEGRKVRWWNGKLYLMFGKYARKYSLQEVIRKDKEYLYWILSKDFSVEIKSLIEDALDGKFPVYNPSDYV